jgi:hypothetical protein
MMGNLLNLLVVVTIPIVLLIVVCHIKFIIRMIMVLRFIIILDIVIVVISTLILLSRCLTFLNKFSRWSTLLANALRYTWISRGCCLWFFIAYNLLFCNLFSEIHFNLRYDFGGIFWWIGFLFYTTATVFNWLLLFSFSISFIK